jgi:hypothetical protein
LIVVPRNLVGSAGVRPMSKVAFLLEAGF